ncbi:MAG: PHP domain-containing protein [Spirochaetales bacterium]|nr:PHP domain-containing protein [Spirochaetales bacterium]
MEKLILDLNNSNTQIRLASLKKLMNLVSDGTLKDIAARRTNQKGLVNNHIHTWYSFSPYSPVKAVWKAFTAGLDTAGIVDHDNAAGAKEFIRAGEITGLPVTVGMECRADFSNTKLKGRRINHPDQLSTAYVVLHGIPHEYIESVNDFFKPFIRERIKRNRKMTEKINDYFSKWKISLNFDRDILPTSKYREGGTVTERHILFALADKFIKRFGKGRSLAEFLQNSLNLELAGKMRTFILDRDNEYYQYDLMGVLKSELLKLFYIPAISECPDIEKVVDFAESINAIPAYAYLGDIAESVTGDKEAQKFEDSYLEELFTVLKKLGFRAITYMPTRNTMEQIIRVRKLCDRFNFLQISGEDINSPRQSFTGKAISGQDFNNLVEATWALIGHERLATENADNGFFSKATELKYPNLKERIEVFAKIGRTKT